LFRSFIVPPKPQYCLLLYAKKIIISTAAERAVAIYHLSIKVVSRGKEKSAVAAAAYRAGETITTDFHDDERA